MTFGDYWGGGSPHKGPVDIFTEFPQPVWMAVIQNDSSPATTKLWATSCENPTKKDTRTMKYWLINRDPYV